MIGPSILSSGERAGPSSLGAPNINDDPERERDAAREFEALLVGQLLRSIRESGSGWLGSGSNSAGSCAIELAEQQLARVLAEQGGLGLASVVEAELRRAPPRSPPIL